MEHDHDTEARYEQKWHRRHHHGAGGGAVYGLGLIGALVYYFQNAHTFDAFVLGLVKALVWPAILVYQALGHWHL